MKNTTLREFSALRSIMIEMTTFCPDCGSKGEVIEFKDLPKELPKGFKNYIGKARFLKYYHI